MLTTRRFAMRATLLALTIGLAIPAAAAAQDAKVKKGMDVYAAQKCAMCHSIGDAGNKKGPLDGVGSKLSTAEIKEWMTDAKGMTAKTKATRKPDMKTYALPADDLDAIVAYMASLKK
jgi:mono/diheme cytochrome c family protein